MKKIYMRTWLVVAASLVIVSCGSNDFDTDGGGTSVAVGSCVYDETRIKEYFVRCSGCHGSEGDVAALGVSRPIAHMPADELYDMLLQYKEGTLNQYELGGIMKGQASLYSDEDLKGLSCYISEM